MMPSLSNEEEGSLPKPLAERFSVLRSLNEGSTGASFLVVDHQQDARRGLLKLMAPRLVASSSERKRIKRELQRQATLSSEILVLPLVVGDVDGVPWLLRDYCDGVSLDVRLREGDLGWTEALLVGVQIARGLEELHLAGLLHRALSPEHIMVCPDAHGLIQVKLIDIGIGAILEPATGRELVGSLGYLAPEQIRGKLTSFRSDLYGLGCVLFEMLSGTPVYAGSEMEALLEAHASAELPDFPEAVPSSLAVLLRSLLAKDPRERPASTEQVRSELEAFLPDHLRSVFASPAISKSTLLGMPAAMEAPPPPPAVQEPTASRPPPPPAAARLPSPPPPPPAARVSVDPTQQLTALDLPDAEELSLGNADGTQQLTALDLEAAEEIIVRQRSVPPPPPEDTAPQPAVSVEAAAAILDPGSGPVVHGSAAFADTITMEEARSPLPPTREFSLELSVDAEASGAEFEFFAEELSQEAAWTPVAETSAEEPSDPPRIRSGSRNSIAIFVVALAILGLAGVGATLFYLDSSGRGGLAGPVGIVEIVEEGAQPELPLDVAPDHAEPSEQVPDEPSAEAEPLTLQALQDHATASNELDDERAPESSDEPVVDRSLTATGPSPREPAQTRSAPATPTPRPTSSRSGAFAEARDQARAQIRAGRYREAVASYQRAAGLNPRHAGVYAGLGAAYLQLGDVPSAIRAYQRAIQLSPSSSGFYAALGRAYLRGGDRARALQAYQRALALDPRNRAAQAALAQLRS